ncbi:Basic leucine zipper and W2 domain-containing protein 2 [Saguinus oedipus]|uniref:eIF5-mimic protein 1 n=1 Tax=Saguinus oedipus TaxID=9490 RepID=A0ABQ9UI49_SAGOE|nr:Basic leucine zipper and W2 domain-containing protein 2 [Saguinus oedipus]
MEFLTTQQRLQVTGRYGPNLSVSPWKPTQAAQYQMSIKSDVESPGGTRIDDGDKTKMTNHCVFSANEDHETIRNYAQSSNRVFNKLIRRYKYLEKAFEDEMKKVKFRYNAYLFYINEMEGDKNSFSETEQTKLAMLSGILLGNGTLPATILTSLFTDSLVKEETRGIAASFAVKLFKAWMAEKDANSVTSSLRKANLDKRLLTLAITHYYNTEERTIYSNSERRGDGRSQPLLLTKRELFPVNRQSVDHFAKYFTDAGLKELSDFLRVQQSLGTRKELQKELQERLSQECPIKEDGPEKEMKRNDLPETAVIGLLWTCIMNAVEWNKKEELVAEQALKHLKQYAPLLAVFSSQGQSELILLQKVQEYCYDNIHFMKAFQKIVASPNDTQSDPSEPNLQDVLPTHRWYPGARNENVLFTDTDIDMHFSSCMVSFSLCGAIKHRNELSTSKRKTQTNNITKLQIHQLSNQYFALMAADVLSEEAILKWYKEAHVAKGKSVFLDQMKKFVEWLQNAEEESESEGEEN